MNAAPLYEMSKEQRRLRGSTRLGCADDQGDDDDDDGVFAKRRWKEGAVVRNESSSNAR